MRIAMLLTHSGITPKISLREHYMILRDDVSTPVCQLASLGYGIFVIPVELWSQMGTVLQFNPT